MYNLFFFDEREREREISESDKIMYLQRTAPRALPGGRGDVFIPKGCWNWVSDLEGHTGVAEG